MSLKNEWKVIASVLGPDIYSDEKMTAKEIISFIPRFVLAVEKWEKLTGPMKKTLLISSLETLAKKFITDEDELKEVDSLIEKYVPEIIDGLVFVANSKEFKAVFSKGFGCKK